MNDLDAAAISTKLLRIQLPVPHRWWGTLSAVARCRTQTGGTPRTVRRSRALAHALLKDYDTVTEVIGEQIRSP